MRELDIIIPVSLDNDWPTKESIIEGILEQHRSYGFKKFALTSPCAGWRGIGFPPEEHYIETAKVFKEVQEELAPFGIECGWWNALTLKSGRTEGFQPIVRKDGSEHPFANCPLCENFKQRFAQSNALFAKIAKPAFILTEDDYSISAAAGCFCDLHLREFERRHGLGLSREELVKFLDERSPEAIEVIKKWRALMGDSMVEFSKAVRAELDKESPEIPMGHAQPGGADHDGDCSLAMAKALAGPRHTPFSRLCGGAYGGIVSRNIPRMLYHMLYCRQHYGEDFTYYMEADTFPHTRFYTAGCQILAAMAITVSWGFDGALFYTQQLLDGANEETTYGKAVARERARLNELHRKVALCNIKGVEIPYDPFRDSLDRNIEGRFSSWLTSVPRFGIPFSTLKSGVAFLEARKVKQLSDAELKAALSGTVFLDGAAAKVLCDRGYGESLGVSVGAPVTEGNRLEWDLCSREVIRPPFAGELKGTHMTAPWLLSKAKLLELKITDENCAPVSEYYSHDRRFITTAMTRFENKLGGKVIVMGLTVEDNRAQALMNYRRKYLFQSLIAWGCDEFVMVKDAPEVMIVENEAKDPGKSGFRELLTLINLCEDPLDAVSLHLPPHLRDVSSISLMLPDGTWQEATWRKTADDIVLDHRLDYCDPMYLLLK